MQAYFLFKVTHPAGTFVGVAPSHDDAREHFGYAAKIEPLSNQDLITMRGRTPEQERVFIAVGRDDL